MRAARIGLVIAVALSMAAPARADTTIGSTLIAAPDASPTCTTTCSVVQDNVIAPTAGVITRWRVSAGTDVTPMRLQVLSGTTQTATSATVTPARSGTSPVGCCRWWAWSRSSNTAGTRPTGVSRSRPGAHW